MAGLPASPSESGSTVARMQLEAAGDAPTGDAEILLQLPLCNASVVKAGKIDSMQQGDLVVMRAPVSTTVTSPVASLSVASTASVTDDHGRIILMRIGTWVYPLSGQLARRSGAGVYVFPGTGAGEFHCLRVADTCADGDLAVLEA